MLREQANDFYNQLKERYRQWILAEGEKSLRRLEKLFARHSLIGDTTFFEVQNFSWAANLEMQWQAIRQELNSVLQKVNELPNFQDISSDQMSITQDDRWKTYFFYAYGIKAHKNCEKCPHTTRLVEQIPGMKTAFFSILLPHKHIPEHRGAYKGLIRYHLGLKVPQLSSKCAIRVGDEVRHWQEGKSLIFDDTFPHQAWNQTDDIRVVLFVDFVRPMRFPAALLNRSIFQLIAWSPYIQGAKGNFEKWDQRLEDIFPQRNQN